MALQKELITELIEKLPPHDSFHHRLHHSITNWLPFYWKGFNQTTRYTYVIEDLSNPDTVWDGMARDIRNRIRKAEKSGIRVVETDDIETFIDLNEMTFTRQGMPLPYSRDFVRRLNSACAQRNARKIYITYGPDGQPHTGWYCVYDNHTMYSVLGGGDPELRNSGAQTLAIWESIKSASKVCKSYDFLGSMIEPIEKFVHDFGAVQKPYFEISKNNSRRLKIRKHGRELLQALLRG